MLRHACAGVRVLQLVLPRMGAETILGMMIVHTGADGL
jgi:hypothetical protein